MVVCVCRGFRVFQVGSWVVVWGCWFYQQVLEFVQVFCFYYRLCLGDSIGDLGYGDVLWFVLIFFLVILVIASFCFCLVRLVFRDVVRRRLVSIRAFSRFFWFYQRALAGNFKDQKVRVFFWSLLDIDISVDYIFSDFFMGFQVFIYREF